MPTIDLTDAEHAEVKALIKRAIEEDKFPLSRRLDLLRSALARLDPAAPPPRPPTPKKAKPGTKGAPRAPGFADGFAPRTVVTCAPEDAGEAPMTPHGDARRLRFLAAADLYVSLRDLAVALHPNDFERAFRSLCQFARQVAPASDLGEGDDAHALRVLGALDCDAFFRRWGPFDDRDDRGPPPSPRAPSPPQRELAPA
jgi:hypothetical protein